VSGRLKLRRGTVVSTEPLLVEVAGERRPAWADEVLLGEMREGDAFRLTLVKVGPTSELNVFEMALSALASSDMTRA